MAGLFEDEIEEWARLVPVELLRVVRSLAGGTSSAWPYKTGASLMGIRPVDPKPRPEGPLAMLTTSSPYGKALERGAYYAHTGWRRKAGRFITKTWRRFARSRADKLARERMDKAVERARRRREKIDIRIGGR